MDEGQLRGRLSLELARYLRLHLERELHKPEKLLKHITFEGIPFEELTRAMLADLNREFPGLRETAEAPYNFVARWWANVNGDVPYEETTFKLYNQSIYFRILDIRDGTEESEARMRGQIEEILRMTQAHGRSTTYEALNRGESHYHEELRALVFSTSELPQEDAWQIIMRQHQVMAGTTFHFFDRTLKASLKEADDLLNNILPERIAVELKRNGKVEPVLIDRATVMFTDIAGFVRISQQLPPGELIAELDYCFSHFDAITRFFGLEKIKTIGDAYMCAGGILDSRPTHAVDIVACALRIKEFMRKYKKSRRRAGRPAWDMRIGIHVGPVIAGIIGETRFTYDIWGDTVNMASRMESRSRSGHINITREVSEMVGDFFTTEYRGKLQVKGKGEIDMYYVSGIQPELSLHGNGRVPSKAFRDKYRELASGNAIISAGHGVLDESSE